MWPFQNNNNQIIRDLRQEADEAWDSYQALAEQIGELKLAVLNMQKPLMSGELENISQKLTDKIADIYVMSHQSVKKRDLLIKSLIKAEIERLTTGFISSY